MDPNNSVIKRLWCFTFLCVSFLDKKNNVECSYQIRHKVETKNIAYEYQQKLFFVY